MNRQMLRRIVAATQGGGVSPITYLMRDMFVTAEASPIASPRTCEPGPGVFTVTQTQGTIAINASGQIEMTGANDVNVNSLYSVDEVVYAAGRALFFDRIAGTAHSLNGWSTTNDFANNCMGVNFLQPAVVLRSSAVTINDRYATYAVVRCSDTRMVWLGYDGVSWKLLWEYSYLGGPTYHYHVSFQLYTNTKNIFDNVLVRDLPAPYNTGYGLATIKIDAPASGQITTSLADHLIAFTWRASTGTILDMQFRRVDDDNCWIVRCTQADATIKLFEKVAGTETERDAGKTQTWTNNTDYAITIISDGAQISTNVDLIRKHNYTSGGFNQTATGVKVSGFTVGANLVCFPRYVPNFNSGAGVISTIPGSFTYSSTNPVD